MIKNIDDTGIDGHRWVGAIYTGAHGIGLAELSEYIVVQVGQQ